MKRRNPYPGLTRTVDRHGKTRWRFRMKGKPSCYISGEYGSKEFESAYQRAINAEPVAALSRAEYGSFDWLIEHYLRTPDYVNLKSVFKRTLTLEIERFRHDYGHCFVADLKPHHVEAMMGRMGERPAAANKLLKLVRRLCKFAVKREVITVDPTYGIPSIRYETDGYHTWTDAEIRQFEDHHGVRSKAVLAMRLMLYTGAARQDAAKMGWQNVKDGRVQYRRHKTGGEVDLPIHDDLSNALANVSADKLLFITHTGDRPYNAATFGMWFKDQCKEAGLPHCTAHGLRKAGATRLADAGASEFEIMAFLGHKTPDEARTYTKRANRAKLGDSAMEKLKIVSNPVERLDNYRRKALKTKEK